MKRDRAAALKAIRQRSAQWAEFCQEVGFSTAFFGFLEAMRSLPHPPEKPGKPVWLLLADVKLAKVPLTVLAFGARFGFALSPGGGRMIPASGVLRWTMAVSWSAATLHRNVRPTVRFPLNTPSSRGFYCLNVTQFLGAANDNILKQLLVFGLAMGGIWEGVLGPGGQAWASLCLAIPFVTLSGFAGQFADKYSKQRVSIVTKWSEVAIALTAIWGLWLQNVWLVLLALVAIAVQSTFFSPAKFGMLPEIVATEKLSRANGTVNMFTYLAIIIGSAVGGPLYECYIGAYGDITKWVPGITILVVGVLGTIASHGIPPLTPQNPEKQINMELFSGYVRTWQATQGTALRSVLVAWTLFYMIIGGIAVLILPDYKEILEITYLQTSLLMALLGISIGVGDYAAGALSGHQIKPSLILYGIVATTVAFLALGIAPPSFAVVTGLLAAGGFMCGFVMVPLQTMVQHLAADGDRGQVLGLWNCLSFVGVIAGNVVFIGIKNTGLASDRVFLVCGGFTLLFTLLYLWRWGKQFRESLPTSV